MNILGGFFHPDANYSQKAIIAAARRCFYSVARFSPCIKSSLGLIGLRTYGFMLKEETSVLPAIEEEHHGSMFLCRTTKAEANWMQMPQITQLHVGSFSVFKV